MENSGHIILGKFATGDGLLVALESLFALRKGKKASKHLKYTVSSSKTCKHKVKDKKLLTHPNVKGYKIRK